MKILSPTSRIINNKIASILLFVFFTFFIFSNSYADKIYKVKANDFLGKIVNKNYSTTHRNSNISKEQVMVAILRANPKAFRGGNIHFLRRVDTLTLPSTEVITLIPQKEASQTISKHYTFFKRNKTGNFPPIALKRPTQDKDENKEENQESKEQDNKASDNKAKTIEKDEVISENTSENIESTESDTTSNTDSETILEKQETETLEGISSTTEDSTETSTSSITVEDVAKSTLKEQEQNATIKSEEIKDLEKRKETQSSTLDQLDNQIQTLEESITNQENSLKNETDRATNTTIPTTESMSGLDSLTEPESETPPPSESISGLDSLTELENNTSDSTSTTGISTNDSTTITGINTDNTEGTANIIDTVSNTSEKTSTLNKSMYLWLLLPIFALLSLLWWWKKSKISTPPSVSTPTSLETSELANKEQLVQTKTEPRRPAPQAHHQKTPTHTNEAKISTPTDTIDTATTPVTSPNTEEKIISDANEEESAIKLDMASAYQAMGYPDEAKEMLEEVTLEGTAQQKEMAEGLLAVL